MHFSQLASKPIDSKSSGGRFLDGWENSVSNLMCAGMRVFIYDTHHFQQKLPDNGIISNYSFQLYRNSTNFLHWLCIL